MRNTGSLLAAAAMMAAAGGVHVGNISAVSPSLSEVSFKNGPSQTNAAKPGDTKAARLYTTAYTGWSARRGKRYSASVRQHQRHAAKRRNRIKSKA